MNHDHITSTMPDTTCDHPANDLIEAVAFGFATPEQEALVREHIATCPVCAAALADASFAAQALPLAAPDIDLPDTVWAGIEQRIAEPAPAKLTSITSPSLDAPTPFRMHWAVAAMLAIMTLAGGILLGRMLFESNDTPLMPVAEVSVTDPDLAATGTVQYLQDQGVILLTMSDMPAPPEGYIYQVWMIEGETPVPVGTFDPESSQWAASGDPSRFSTLAITVEEGPRGSDQPTTDPIVVADLTQLIAD